MLSLAGCGIAPVVTEALRQGAGRANLTRPDRGATVGWRRVTWGGLGDLGTLVMGQWRVCAEIYQMEGCGSVPFLGAPIRLGWGRNKGAAKQLLRCMATWPRTSTPPPSKRGATTPRTDFRPQSKRRSRHSELPSRPAKVHSRHTRRRPAAPEGDSRTLLFHPFGGETCRTSGPGIRPTSQQ
jgi:hypothetical protein